MSTAPIKKIHKPVMLHRVLDEAASLEKGSSVVKLFFDCTMGDGGHSYELFSNFVRSNSQSYLISIDWDRENFEFVKSFFSEYPREFVMEGAQAPLQGSRWLYVQSNFSKLQGIYKKFIAAAGIEDSGVNFILLDLGISSRQLANANRGFSFTNSSSLDMRMDPQNYNVKASDLLNLLGINKLTEMFLKTVGMHKTTSRSLAKELVAERERRKFGNKDDIKRINDICERVMPLRKSSFGKLHPSTLVFLALRIAVNTELQNLNDILSTAAYVLSNEGKMLVMTYHSAEEKLVDAFIQRSHLTVKKYLPSKNEITGNPRARSAKLFVITK